MGKLNNSQRKIVGTNCISASRKNSADKQVVVYTTGKNAGLAVKGAISAAYPSYKFYKAESIGANLTGQILFGIFTWGAGNAIQAASQTWKNFTVKTTSSEEAKNLVKEIDSCIAQYGGYAEEMDEPVYSGGDEESPGGTGGSTKAKNWTTYIVIGAAAVVILLLLWDRKK